MKLRVANSKDSEFLLRIRNDEQTRAMSHTQEPITADEHREWFDKTTDRVFIAEVDGERVGSVRFVRHPHELEMGIIVAPEHRGKGYSAEMIRLGRDAAWAQVVAYVRVDNVQSYKAFIRAGFAEDRILYSRFTSS